MLAHPPWYCRWYLTYRVFTGRSTNLPDWYFRRLLMAARKAARAVCTLETHEWRGVAAPYAVQCRKCGVSRFALDEKGNFPDGLREYIELARKGQLHRVEISPPWICDNVISGIKCGAQMSVKASCDKCGKGMVIANVALDPSKETWFCRSCGNMEKPNTGLGPIYLCPQCQSWRKVSYV